MFEEIGRGIDSFLRIRVWSIRRRLYWAWQRHVKGVEPPTLAEITQKALQRNSEQMAASVFRNNALLDRLGYTAPEQAGMVRESRKATGN